MDKLKPKGGVQPAQVWRESFTDEARQAVLAGCTSNRKLGEYFGVTHHTISRWRDLRPEFDIAIKHASRALLSEVTNQMLLSATEHQVISERVMPDGSVVRYKKTVQGNVRAQENLARVLGSIAFGSENPWDVKSKVEVSGSEENPLAFLMNMIATESKARGPLPKSEEIN